MRGELRARVGGQRGEQRGVEEAGRDRADADRGGGELARGGQRHRGDRALGRGVRDLPDLPVERRDRGGVDADAALAVLARRLVGEHRHAREAQRVERPDDVDREHALEGVQPVRAAAASEPLSVADPRALHGDPQAPGRLCGGVDGTLQLRRRRGRRRARTARARPARWRAPHRAQRRGLRRRPARRARAARARSPRRAPRPRRRRARLHPRFASAVTLRDRAG